MLHIAAIQQMSKWLWNSFNCQYALPLYPLTPIPTPTFWPGSAKYGSLQHHALTDKLGKGDNQHCTLILREISRSTSWWLVIRCAARCLLDMHSTLHITLYIRPCVTLSCGLQLPIISRPNHHSHLSTSQKHLLTTSLTPPLQAGLNQLPVEWIDKSNRGGWQSEVIQSLEHIPHHDPSIFLGPGMIIPTWSWFHKPELQSWNQGLQWRTKLVPLLLYFPRDLWLWTSLAHILLLFRPCKTPFTAPSPPVCSIQRVTGTWQSRLCSGFSERGTQLSN